MSYRHSTSLRAVKQMTLKELMQTIEHMPIWLAELLLKSNPEY